MLLAAFSPAGFDRIARRADGWLPVGMPPEVIAGVWAGIRHAAEDFGRDPVALQLVVRANVKVTTTPLGPTDRPPFTGTVAQIAGDLRATQEPAPTSSSSTYRPMPGRARRSWTSPDPSSSPHD